MHRVLCAAFSLHSPASGSLPLHSSLEITMTFAAHCGQCFLAFSASSCSARPRGAVSCYHFRQRRRSPMVVILTVTASARPSPRKPISTNSRPLRGQMGCRARPSHGPRLRPDEALRRMDRIKLSGEAFSLQPAARMPRASRSSPMLTSERANRQSARRGLLPAATSPSTRSLTVKLIPSSAPLLPGLQRNVFVVGVERGHRPRGFCLSRCCHLRRIGGDPNNLTEAYRPQLAALDRVLAGCGHGPTDAKRTSIFDIPPASSPAPRSSNCRAWASHHCFYAG